MTNHTGALLEVRDALEKSGIDLSNSDRDAIIAKLDALIASVPEGLGEALREYHLLDANKIVNVSGIINAAALLHDAVRGE